MNSKTILITGGSGYIGSHLTHALLQQHQEVMIFDVSHPHPDLLECGAQYVFGDVRKLSEVMKVFSKTTPHRVVHLAAISEVTDKGFFEKDVSDITIQGGANVLAAMKKHGCSSIVFASSAAVYGNTIGKAKEAGICHPLSEYGRAKFAFEKKLKRASLEDGINVVIFRLFNVGGFINGVPLTQRTVNKKTLLLSAVRTLEGIQPVLPIYGSHFPTKDGSALRDHVHISDVIRAFLLVLQDNVKGYSPLLVNIGSGIGTTNMEVIQTIERKYGKCIALSLESGREYEVPSSIASIRLAKNILGWSPISSNIALIVESILKNYRHVNDLKYPIC